MRTKTPNLLVGDIVTVDSRPGTVWRILTITSGVAHLTKLRSSHRNDLRGVPVGRLSLARSVL